GIVLKIVNFEKTKKFSTFLYLMMGWFIILSIKSIYTSAGLGAIAYLAAGGVAYSVGTIFYSMKSVKFMHVIWHLFVATGSVFMWLSLYLYVA
ncbi:MAG: hemolysin III family protein, partial [bacterium]|nr:hemolysin III family protein [bacterium]